MTMKFLRNESGGLNKVALSVAATAIIGLSSFVLVASAKTMFGSPVEVKYQNNVNEHTEERLIRLEQQMAIANAKLDTLLTYQISKNLRGKIADAK